MKIDHSILPVCNRSMADIFDLENLKTMIVMNEPELPAIEPTTKEQIEAQVMMVEDLKIGMANIKMAMDLSDLNMILIGHYVFFYSHKNNFRSFFVCRIEIETV